MPSASIFSMKSSQPDTGECSLYLDHTGAITLNLTSRPQPRPGQDGPVPECLKLKGNWPRSKEWYRIEITHEEGEDGKYYISFSVNGKKSERKPVGFMMEIIDDVKITSGGRVPHEALQPGLIRGVVVLGSWQ